MYKIAESVTKYHPDKICDQISDAIVDACIDQDPLSRVAVETMGGHGQIHLTGEVTTKADVDYEAIAAQVYFDLMGKDIDIEENIVHQSPDISQGVDSGGAGDQGIMIGYACNENESHIPQELYICRKLLAPFNTDGKSQVVLDNTGNMLNVVLSVQGKTQKELLEYFGGFIATNYPKNPMPSVYCNNTGSFDIGGFDADAGVTGRKIVVDAYGPRVPVGGGAFSGKDPTKMDRSAAYMARYIALHLLKEKGAKEVMVKIGYVIGKAEPLLKQALIDGVEETFDYDCRPRAIIDLLDLRKPIYRKSAEIGPFGNDTFNWEK
jgi:S-adenosylmethionine synthetase